eukprot:COSAG02_NODE_25720_length_651_cov_0.833333_2_plen_77_part_01
MEHMIDFFGIGDEVSLGAPSSCASVPAEEGDPPEDAEPAPEPAADADGDWDRALDADLTSLLVAMQSQQAALKAAIA